MLKKLMCAIFAAAVSAGSIAHAASDCICNHDFRRRPGYIMSIPEDYLGHSFSAIDWDGDGDIDILAPDKRGRVFVYENEGEDFFRNEEPVAKVPVTDYMGSAISAVDWDGDGDIDILAAEGMGNVFLYENTGNGFRRRGRVARIPATLYRGYAFCARDFNEDGKIDILAARGNGWVYLYENKNGVFVRKDGVIVKVPASFYHGSALSAADWDRDGMIDILAMDRNGDIVLYKGIK